MQTNSSNSSLLNGQNLAYQTLGLLQQNSNLINQQAQTSPTNETIKDTTFTKIFVGGLPYHTTDESLRSFFERFGKIEEAVVILDRSTGKSRGYGFVTMETKEGAEAAILDPNPIIDGRKANVNLAYLGVKSRVVQPTSYIPLALTRYPIPIPSTAAYGIQPLYYPQMSGTTVQPTFQLAATPNLILPSQNTSATFSPLTSSLTSTTGANLLDLYNNQQLTSNQFLQFGSAQLANSTQNNLSSVLTTANSQPAASYFSIAPQNLTSFQSQ